MQVVKDDRSEAVVEVSREPSRQRHGCIRLGNRALRRGEQTALEPRGVLRQGAPGPT